MQESLQSPGAVQTCMARALLAAVIMAGASLAHAQNAPKPPLTAQDISGPFTPPKLPALAHEQAPVQWPAPDYYMQALDSTGLKVGPRASALKVRGIASELPDYIALPVQGQAFGFSPQFRALAGALLDQHLERAGIRATTQIDITDTYGPFVRRFSEASIDTLGAENPKRKTISLYIGHDGIGQMFITLVVRQGKQRTTAHKAIALPAEALLAADQIAQALPGLLKETGLPVRATAAAAAGPLACNASAWSFAPPAGNASAGEHACHAIAVAMLLPSYDSYPQFNGVSEEVSPAKLAWLARAYTLAATGALAPATSDAIKQLAQKGLGFSKVGSNASLPQLNDPVVQRLIKLEQLDAATQMAPVRSAREAQGRQLESMARDLPPFARALFSARTDFIEPLSKVDLCTIERLLPQAMPRATCRDGSTDVAPARPPWPAESLMYQEWRLASYHKELTYAALTQGSRPRTEDALSRWPQDVADHPYLQRLRYIVSTRREVSGGFDEQLKAARESSRAITQTSVDLQRADRWLASHSLTGHMWTGNMHVLNDAQVREMADKEMRLLSVLRFDRFTLDRYLARRQPGATAFFLAPAMWLHMLTDGMPQLVVSMDPPVGNSAPPVPLLAPKRSLFATPRTLFDGWKDEVLRQSLARNPGDLHARLTVALGQLQDGGSMTEALKLLDAQPVDQRTDNRIGQSHAWAEPAHYFYFAGELAAARKYYQKVADIGTGSESDMMARTRLKLIDGNLREALRSTTARVERYDSDFARRDQASLLFMFGQRDKAWDAFMSRATSAEVFQLWVGAYTGHRIESATLDQIDAWILSKKLDKAQIDRWDVSQLYQHLQVVMDRLPEEADIQRLKRPRGAEAFAGRFLSTSARLFRSALLDAGFAEAYRDATAALKDSGDNPSSSYMQSLYAWAAWQASAGKDDFIQEVRATTTRSGFDEMLAKSMVLALEGDTKESLRFYTAARFQLAETSDRWVPGLYSYALAGFLMHRRTGNDAFRQETLRFVRSQQAVFPYYGWLYAMDALLESDLKKRRTAACRARFLDPGSYFLRLAKVPGLDANTCKEPLSSLLR